MVPSSSQTSPTEEPFLPRTACRTACLGNTAAWPDLRAPHSHHLRPWSPTCCASFPGVSKIVTVDVKGSSPLWLKVKDLAEGMTYRFRIRAKTFTYGPEIEANVTTGPGEGRGAQDGQGGRCRPHTTFSP